MSAPRSLIAVVALAALAGGATSLAVLDRLASDPRPSAYGVRLGMTADEVRAHVDERGGGSWSASAASGDWILEHVRGSERARFELHDGQVMAIRIEAIAAAPLTGPPLEVTEGTVLSRVTEGEHIRWTLLSRACPTHRAEAEALVTAGSYSLP